VATIELWSPKAYTDDALSRGFSTVQGGDHSYAKPRIAVRLRHVAQEAPWAGLGATTDEGGRARAKASRETEAHAGSAGEGEADNTASRSG